MPSISKNYVHSLSYVNITGKVGHETHLLVHIKPILHHNLPMCYPLTIIDWAPEPTQLSLA